MLFFVIRETIIIEINNLLFEIVQNRFTKIFEIPEKILPCKCFFRRTRPTPTMSSRPRPHPHSSRIIVEYIIGDSGNSENYKNEVLHSPNFVNLVTAIKNGQHSEIKRLLLNLKIRINPSLFYTAVVFSPKATVQWLIEEKEIDVHETGIIGRSCYTAIKYYRLETLKYLHDIDDFMYLNATLCLDCCIRNPTNTKFASTGESKEIVKWMYEELRVDIHDTAQCGKTKKKSVKLSKRWVFWVKTGKNLKNSIQKVFLLTEKSIPIPKISTSEKIPLFFKKPW